MLLARVKTWIEGYWSSSFFIGMEQHKGAVLSNETRIVIGFTYTNKISLRKENTDKTNLKQFPTKRTNLKEAIFIPQRM